MRAVYLISPALVFASSWACHAEETPFSQGLKRLADLGLPAMQGAEWVKAPGEFSDGFTDSYEFREMSVRLSGNAWQLPTDPPTHLMFGSAKEADLPESDHAKKKDDGGSDEKPGLLGKMLRNYQEQNPEPEKKPKAPAEPAVSLAAKDATKLAEALRKPSVAEEINNRMRWGDANLHGRIMLFAAQLQAAGETESANTLAAALFQAINDKPAVIDGAISHLADTEYAAAASAFFETTDWAAYHTAIKALLEKYPRGWADAPAVALLSSHLEKRAATPPPLSLPGITLKPEALALLDKLLEKQTIETSDEALAKARGMDLSRYPARQRAEMVAWLRANAGEGVSFSDPTLWLLPSEKSDDEPPASPVEALKAMRMDGFIALAAAVTDETLVPIRKQSERSSYYSSSESAAALIRRRYANLNRPISRGEIAAALISAVLPTPEDNRSFSSSSEPDPADLAANAVEFWKTNKDKSAVEIATLYIAEGNDTQRSLASSFLASSKDPAAHEAFEKTVLAANDPLSLIQAVEGYLGSRKAATKPFATAYIKLLRENPPSEEDLQRTSSGWQIREAGGLENYLKKLSLKVGDVSLRKMIAEALRAKAEPSDDEDEESKSPIAALAPAIQSVPFDECLLELGNAAAAATPAQWMEINHLLLRRILMEQGSDGDGESQSFRVLPENIMAIWKPLMARPEALPEKGNFPRYARGYGANTVGDAATLLIEMASSLDLTYMIHYYLVSEGPAVIMETARKRVAAWSSGHEPEAWPNEENVSGERKEEIAKKLAGLKADEIIPYIRSLTKDERLAFHYMAQSYGDTDPVPPGILELRNTLVSLKPALAHDHNEEAAAKLGLAVGDKITPELVSKIADTLLTDAVNNSPTTVMFSPGPTNLGISLYVTTNMELDLMQAHLSGLRSTAGLFSQHGNPDAMSVILADHTGDIRILKDGKPVTLVSEGSGLSYLTKALASKSFTLPVIRITVLTRADAEKINNQDQ